jgi:hypothetical protein
MVEPNEKKETTVEENVDRKEKGKGFRNYGKSILSYKYWVLGGTLVVGILGYLATSAVINPSREKMVSYFTLNIPTQVRTDSTGKKSLTYLDGSVFDYHDILSPTNIRAVATTIKDVQGNTKYANVSVDALIQNSGISISLQKTSDGTSLDASSLKYQVTAQVSYFKTLATAQSFLSDLVDETRSQAETLVSSYAIDDIIPSDPETAEFDALTHVLSTQYTMLNDGYANLLTQVGDTTIVDDTTVAAHYQQFQQKYAQGTGDVFSGLSGALTAHAYVRYTEGQEAAKISQLKTQGENDKALLSTANNQIGDAEKRLADLTASGNTSEVLGAAIIAAESDLNDLRTSRTRLIAELTLLGYSVSSTDFTVAPLDETMASPVIGQIQHLNNPTANGWDTANTAFAVSLNDNATLLRADISPTNAFIRTAFRKNGNSVSYDNVGVGVLTGHVSNAIGAAGGVLLGFIASTLICYGWDCSQKRKKAAVPATVATDEAKKPEVK